LKELGEEDEDLRCDIINDAKAVRATAAAARAAAVFVVPAGPPQLASGSGAASSSSGAAAAPPAGAAIAAPPLAVRSIERKIWLIEDARALIPVAKGCKLWIHKGTAWQITYTAKPHWPRSHSCSWIDGCDVSHFDNLVYCLRWAWSAHKALTGEACPFDLGVPI
jgi:hypothetical protein